MTSFPALGVDDLQRKQCWKKSFPLGRTWTELDIVSPRLSMNYLTLAAHWEQFSHLFYSEENSAEDKICCQTALDKHKGTHSTATELNPCHSPLFKARGVGVKASMWVRSGGEGQRRDRERGIVWKITQVKGATVSQQCGGSVRDTVTNTVTNIEAETRL